jgi:hypothetical protein
MISSYAMFRLFWRHRLNKGTQRVPVFFHGWHPYHGRRRRDLCRSLLRPEFFRYRPSRWPSGSHGILKRGASGFIISYHIFLCVKIVPCHPQYSSDGGTRDSFSGKTFASSASVMLPNRLQRLMKIPGTQKFQEGASKWKRRLKNWITPPT